MNDGMDRYKIYALIVFIVQILLILLFQLVLHLDYSFLALVFTLVDGVIIMVFIYLYESTAQTKVMSVSRILGNDAKDAFIYGQIGIVIYDDDYTVTWVNELFEQRQIELLGQSIIKAIPPIEELFKGESDRVEFVLNGRRYEAIRREDAQILFFKDITEQSELTEKYNNEQAVMGIINLDNYTETIQYEDEQQIAAINTNIRQKVIEWAASYQGLVRRLNHDRLLVVISEENFNRMVSDRFDILETVKNEAANLDVAITASMAFATGTSDFAQLDNMLNDLLELTLSRGGDQVAVRVCGQDVRFYGTSSPASEKRSKVRARVIAQSLHGIISESDKVIIVPHSDADFDAMGACMGMSRIVLGIHKPAFIVAHDIELEKKAGSVLQDHLDELSEIHEFISEQEALDKLTKKTLVLVVDHHSMDLTAAPLLVAKAKRLVIIDHHRRRTDTNLNAMMIYNEPAASSTVELVSELLQYQATTIDLTDLEATYMYTGILVDSDNFKAHAGSRTFEACAYLRKNNADIAKANDWLKDTYEEFIKKTDIMKFCQQIGNGMIMSAIPEESGNYLSRTVIAQAANTILMIQKVEAVFVIAQIDSNEWAISARSNGRVNVQMIMETMGGGGHFNAAGIQRSNTSVGQLDQQLRQAIDKYVEEQGVENNENNLVK